MRNSGPFILVAAVVLTLGVWSGVTSRTVSCDTAPITPPAASSAALVQPELVQLRIVPAMAAARLTDNEDICDFLHDLEEWLEESAYPDPPTEFEYSNTYTVLNNMLGVIAQIQNPHVSPNLSPANAGQPGATPTFSNWEEGIDDVSAWLAQARHECCEASIPNQYYIGYRLDSAKKAIELLLEMIE